MKIDFAKAIVKAFPELESKMEGSVGYVSYVSVSICHAFRLCFVYFSTNFLSRPFSVLLISD